MKRLLISAISIILASGFFMPALAEPFKPKLLWEKVLYGDHVEIDLATESADVIISKGKNEISVFDKKGKETFSWEAGPDRHCGGVSISGDAGAFMFYSGYTEEYAYRNNVRSYSDDRVHYFSGETKKELWYMPALDTVPVIFPDGSGFLTAYPVMEIFNLQKKLIYRHPEQIGGFSFVISPESNYIALVPDSGRPLMLLKRDGALLWEQGRHTIVSSMSDGASYITTQPYVLAYTKPDKENTHLGTVYDRGGNKVMEGYGIVSGNGQRIVMLEDKGVSIYSLPGKELLKRIPGEVELPRVSTRFFAAFSHDGKYLVMRNGNEIHFYGIQGDVHEIVRPGALGKFPYIAITRDARYLLVNPSSVNRLALYQLY